MKTFEIRETIEVHVCSECPYAERTLTSRNARNPYDYHCTYNEGRRLIADPYRGIDENCEANDGDII